MNFKTISTIITFLSFNLLVLSSPVNDDISTNAVEIFIDDVENSQNTTINKDIMDDIDVTTEEETYEIETFYKEDDEESSEMTDEEETSEITNEEETSDITDEEETSEMTDEEETSEIMDEEETSEITNEEETSEITNEEEASEIMDDENVIINIKY